MKTPEETLDIICSALTEEGVGSLSGEVRSRSRKNHLVVARHLYTFVRRQYYRERFESIGSFLGRHHSTLVNGEGRAVDMIETEGYVGRAYLSICGRMGVKPPNWITPRLTDRVRIVSSTKRPGRMAPGEVRAGDMGPEEVARWTPEQEKRLKEYRKSGMSSMGL